MLTAALVAATITATGSVAYHHWATPRWRERNIHTGRFNLTALSSLSIPLALALTVLATPALNKLPGHTSVAAAAALGAWTGLAVLSISTDLASTKIPRDACLLASTLGIAAVASTVNPRFMLLALIAFLVLTGIAIFARFLVGGLGFSDVRILAAAGLTLGWWIPFPYLLFGMIAASILQILLRLLLPKTLLARIVEAPDPDTAESETIPLRKRPLPFAPALVVGITGCAVLAAATASTTCDLWPGLC